jgi:hypothetical protein
MPLRQVHLDAGGRGERLFPLTRDRAKPAVPFGGRYRIIDFALSNFINSGFFRIKVLSQYRSNSLLIHLARGFNFGSLAEHYVDPIPAAQGVGEMGWYVGTADAIYQNLSLVQDEMPQDVAIFGGDHIYKMDVRQMMDFHRERLRVLAEAGDSIKRFYDSGVLELRDRLGPVLWQFAPTKKFDEADFGAFLELLPDKFDGHTLRHVVEVRHDSFKTPAFIALLRKFNTPVVYAEHDTYTEIADVTGLPRLVAAMRQAASQLFTRKRLGRDVFARGMPDGVRTIRERQYTADIYDLLKAYADQRKRTTAKRAHVVRRRVVWSIKDARQRLERLIGLSSGGWMQLDIFIGEFLPTPELSRTALASSFGATLEMARDGLIEIRQDKPFAPVEMRSRLPEAERPGGR